MGDIGCQDAPDRFAAVSLDATGGRNQTYPVNSAQSRNVTYNILSAGEENSSPTEAWKQSFLKRDYYRSAIRISPATAAAATTISTTTTVSDVNACPRCHDAPHLNLPPLTKSHTERERRSKLQIFYNKDPGNGNGRAHCRLTTARLRAQTNMR